MLTPIPVLAEWPVADLPPLGHAGWRPSISLAQARRAEHTAFVCSRDGLTREAHPRCQACGILAGPAHPLAPVLVHGLCGGCG